MPVRPVPPALVVPLLALLVAWLALLLALVVPLLAPRSLRRKIIHRLHTCMFHTRPGRPAPPALVVPLLALLVAWLALLLALVVPLLALRSLRRKIVHRLHTCMFHNCPGRCSCCPLHYPRRCRNLRRKMFHRLHTCMFHNCPGRCPLHCPLHRPRRCTIVA